MSFILTLKFALWFSQTPELISFKSQVRQQALSAGYLLCRKGLGFFFATLLYWVQFQWCQNLSGRSLESMRGLAWQLAQLWYLHSLPIYSHLWIVHNLFNFFTCNLVISRTSHIFQHTWELFMIYVYAWTDLECSITWSVWIVKLEFHLRCFPAVATFWFVLVVF